MTEKTPIQITLEKTLDQGHATLKIERRRSRVVIWSVVAALLLNAIFLASGVARDRQHTRTIRSLATSVDGLTSENQLLNKQLMSQSVGDEKALADAFALLNQLRDVVANVNSQLASNAGELHVLQAEVQSLQQYILVLQRAKPGQVVIRPVFLNPPARAPSVPTPAPIVLAPSVAVQPIPNPPAATPTKSCLVIIIIPILC